MDNDYSFITSRIEELYGKYRIKDGEELELRGDEGDRQDLDDLISMNALQLKALYKRMTGCIPHDLVETGLEEEEPSAAVKDLAGRVVKVKYTDNGTIREIMAHIPDREIDDALIDKVNSLSPKDKEGLAGKYASYADYFETAGKAVCERVEKCLLSYETRETQILECILNFPWLSKKPPKVEFSEIRERFSSRLSLVGMEDVYEEVVLSLASGIRNNDPRGVRLLLCGPAGVGKTTVAKAVAAALKMPFVQISLSGVTDAGTLKGFYSTWAGADCGMVYKKIKEAGTRRCVMLLDEIDKMSMGFANGNPQATLLELLNSDGFPFTDLYANLEIDLSETIFIATANGTESLFKPLIDRFQLISVPDYNFEQKVEIANNYTLPKKLREHNVAEGAIVFAKGAMEHLVRNYGGDTGIRNIERAVDKTIRFVFLEWMEKGDNNYKVTADTVDKAVKFRNARKPLGFAEG